MTKEEALILLQEHFSEGMVRTIMDSLKQEHGEPVCDECGNGGGYALYCVACAEKFFCKAKEWIGLNGADWNDFNPLLVNDPHRIAEWVEKILRERNT